MDALLTETENPERSHLVEEWRTYYAILPRTKALSALTTDEYEGDRHRRFGMANSEVRKIPSALLSSRPESTAG